MRRAAAPTSTLTDVRGDDRKAHPRNTRQQVSGMGRGEHPPVGVAGSPEAELHPILAGSSPATSTALCQAGPTAAATTNGPWDHHSGIRPLSDEHHS